MKQSLWYYPEISYAKQDNPLLLFFILASLKFLGLR